MSDSRLTVLMETEGTYPHNGGGVSTWCDALITQLSDVDFHLVSVTGSPHAELRYELPSNLDVHLLPTWGTEEPSEFAQPHLSFVDLFRRRTETDEAIIEREFVPLFEQFMGYVLHAADAGARTGEHADERGEHHAPGHPPGEASGEAFDHHEVYDHYAQQDYHREGEHGRSGTSGTAPGGAGRTNGRLAPVIPEGDLAETVHRMYRYFQRYDYKKTFRSQSIWDVFCRLVLERYEDAPVGESPSAFDLTVALRWTYNFLLPLSVTVPEKADVTHATLAGFSGLLSVAAKYERGIPMLVTDHGIFARERYMAVAAGKTFSFFAKRMMMGLTIFSVYACYQAADQISPVCDHNHRWEKYLGADPDKIKTIYNGVPPDVFTPQLKPAHTRGRPTVVAAARVFPLKDIETMIRSCAVVRESIPNVQYLCYGSTDADPEYTERCENLISELGLSDHFKLAGFHDSPAELYNEGDLSVLSSVSEGFPYTVIEAMSCGRAVVATDVGGVSEALEGCGIIVPPRNPKALGEGVARLLNDDDLRGQLGRQARERVLQRFRLADAIDAYRKTYHRLAHRATPPHADDGEGRSGNGVPEDQEQESIPERWLGRA